MNQGTLKEAEDLLKREAERILRPIYEKALRILDEVGALEPLPDYIDRVRRDRKEFLPDLGPLVIVWEGSTRLGDPRGVRIVFAAPVHRDDILRVFLPSKRDSGVEVTVTGAGKLLEKILEQNPQEDPSRVLARAVQETLDAYEEAARKFLAWAEKVAASWRRSQGYRALAGLRELLELE